MAKRMSLLDATFLNIETRDTPMHVASLAIFQRPEGAPRSFVKAVVENYRSKPPTSAPWNLKLQKVAFAGVAPATAAADSIDMDYHVRHTALPEPGGERELGELVSHLHTQLLDRTRPLWTCHVIDGLANDRFAIFTKAHHALTDGIKGIRMVERALSKTPDGQWSAPWHWQRPENEAPSPKAPKSSESVNPTGQWQDWGRHLANAARPNRKALRGPEDTRVIRAFQAPNSTLNGPVTAARRVATQSLDIASIKAISKRSGTSLNDVFLALCSSAIRRHLLSSNDLPDQPLVSGVPVSLREPGDADSSNAVGFLWASLATNKDDPLDRLQAIHDSMQASKNHLLSLPPKARSVYTMATMTPAIGVLMLGLGAKIRPPMNVTISNVPGPADSLFLNGARMEALYPVSLPFQGQGLNITCISYDGKLNVGFVGSRDALPSLQRMAVYCGEALDELDTATQ